MTEALATLYRSLFDVIAIVTGVGLAAIAFVAGAQHSTVFAVIAVVIAGALWVLTFGLLAVLLVMAQDLRELGEEAAQRRRERERAARIR